MASLLGSPSNPGDGVNLGVSDSIQGLGSSTVAGIVGAYQNTSGLLPALPWKNSNITSDFFQSIQIDPSRWDELFPYRLMVIDCTNNQIVSGSAGALPPAQVKLTVEPGTGNSIVSFLQPATPWIFQLPISPQQFSIQDQFAINITPTLKGILAEHAGVRFKMINAQGTFGVWAQRSSVSKPPSSPSIVQSLFGGTIEAAGSVVTSINNAINVATGNHPANKPTSLRPETSSFGQTSTGYYQALKLEQFLEQYAEAKKNPANASWRLVFDVPKQNQSFVVEPLIYDWQQNANDPMKISFNFQLKAWRRVFLNQTPQQVNANNQPLSPGILQRILGTIAALQNTLSSIQNLLQAVVSDVEQPLNILRQTVLLVKTLAGIATTVADLPNQLVQDFSSSIATSLNILQSSIRGSITDPKTIGALNGIVGLLSISEGLSLSAVTSGQLGTSAANNIITSPSMAPFSNPAGYYTLLSQVPLSSLSLTTAQQNSVVNIINAASQTTVAQLKQYRQQILNLGLALSNSFGTGSTLYNQLYNLPPPSTREQPITVSEYEILSAVYDVVASYDILTATTQIDDQNIGTALDYVAGLAATITGLTFNTPTSKTLAPVPYGLSIEQIAARYLGDPNLWLEIATLNNLVEPYIDNTGFQYSLLSNAIGRQVVIGDDADLYVGQTVYLLSNTQSMVARNITAIETLASSTSFLITLDGLANLDNFLLQDGAYLQAYLPGTVNYMQKIFIPSNLPVPDVGNVLPPPTTTGDPLTGLSKVDWLLQENGDLALSGSGDFLYSYGLTNIIQALRIKFATKLGSVLLHQNFGLNIAPGISVAEVNMQDLYNSINTMITQDPRFSGVQSLQIIQNGPDLTINLGITIPNQTGVFPVSFALNPNQNQ
jgi:hypothetical protein